ncbi:MAG TPA: DCC1-like thiol-disulfide oxidoreductase family protein [Candidatus Solibacter sp.]|nr:DCC1-like thiol-disulfide oxidoreductase family protein [Candidatus Solibacter sp.]
MVTPTDTELRQHNIVFYDGECGLCQGFVRFLLALDAARRFYYSPLQGQLIVRALDGPKRASLPDSLVLLTPDGVVRTRSAAVLEAMERLGGFWRFCAILARVIPRALRDGIYNYIARRRREVFGGTHYHCPLVPAEMRDRFVE